MPVALSRGARALLRAYLTGEPVEAPFGEARFVRELERAGLVAPADGETASRLTGAGEASRWEFLPHPDGPSAEALSLLKRLADGEGVDVRDENRRAYRELAAAGLMTPLHTFAGGDESAYRLTEAGVSFAGRPASSGASHALVR